MGNVPTHELDKRITSHEVVCADRYGRIIERLDRLEKIVMASAGSAIVGMAAILIKILMGV